MYIRQWLPLWLAFIYSNVHLAICAPTQFDPSHPIHATNTDFLLSLPNRLSDTTLCELGTPPKNSSHPLRIDHITWPISTSLSLAITICAWQLNPATIVSVLAAAATTVGKRPAAGILHEDFIQRSDNKYNTLYFEIGPGSTHRQMTWGDVGEVLGESGLLLFYERTRSWPTLYFNVVDVERGELGRGAVRRWWQLEKSAGRNTTAGVGSLGVDRS